MVPCRCERNTSELPQCGQCRLGSTFIPNAPYYINLGYTRGSDSDSRCYEATREVSKPLYGV